MNDANGNELERNEVSLFFINSQNKSLSGLTEIPRVLKPLAFNARISHLIQVVTNDNNTVEDKHKFIFDQPEDGYIKIRLYTRDPYLKYNYFLDLITSDFEVYNQPDPESYDLKFRFLSATVEWVFEDQPTLYSATIIPPAKQGFAFDQIIIYCSAATGTYEVGTDRKEETITTIAFEESINIISMDTIVFHPFKSSTQHSQTNGPN